MTHEIAVRPAIPAMSDAAITKVREWESLAIQKPQAPLHTWHHIHAGMYARTIMLPADAMLTGALLKVATMLILSGDAVVFLGDNSLRFTGYHVLPASAGRKQVIVAVADTYLTMMFATKAKTVEEAEHEFTDEFDLLVSHRDDNTIVITGE